MESQAAQTESGAAECGEHDEIERLVCELSDLDGEVRTKVRARLVDIGKPAVPALIEALAASSHQVRWEAAQALKQMAEPSAASALVRALEDPEFDVRWLAAEALIALRRKGLWPLLEALKVRSDSLALREGAHHVLGSLVNLGLRKHLTPVMSALNGVQPVIEVPIAARAALKALRSELHRDMAPS
jgi:HEAT repeat protein